MEHFEFAKFLYQSVPQLLISLIRELAIPEDKRYDRIPELQALQEVLESYFVAKMDDFELGPTYKSTLDAVEFGDISLVSDGNSIIDLSDLSRRTAWLVEGHFGALMDRCDDICRTMKYKNNQNRGRKSTEIRSPTSTRLIDFPPLFLPTPPPMPPRRSPPSPPPPPETPSRREGRRPALGSGRPSKRQRLDSGFAGNHGGPSASRPRQTSFKSSPGSTPPSISVTAPGATLPSSISNLFTIPPLPDEGSGSGNISVNGQEDLDLDPGIFDIFFDHQHPQP